MTRKEEEGGQARQRLLEPGIWQDEEMAKVVARVVSTSFECSCPRIGQDDTGMAGYSE